MKKATSETQLNHFQTLTLGDYAHTIIGEQYRNLIKEEKKVLADKDPEHLHKMRVSSRRLRTALQVFGMAIRLPKIANANQIGALARTLGSLRDLDVQMADLREHYRPQLPKAERSKLDEVLEALQQQRKQTFATVETALTRSRYQELKAAYENWLEQPEYTDLAQLPLPLVLPDLLSPLLSELLLHPGWLVPAPDSGEAASETLHDLRKAFKHVRYQAEFFAACYPAAFHDWLEEVKTWQANLGTVQDCQVLQDLLKEHLPRSSHLPQLQAAINQTQDTALADWEPTRQKYLSPDFRHQLRQQLLSPEFPAPATEPAEPTEQTEQADRSNQTNQTERQPIEVGSSI